MEAVGTVCGTDWGSVDEGLVPRDMNFRESVLPERPAGLGGMKSGLKR